MNFGSRIKIKIPTSADLLAGIYLNLTFSDLVRDIPYLNQPLSISTTTPQFTSYVNGLGYNIIDEAKLYINGLLVDSINGEIIAIANELENNYSKKQAFYKMTKYVAPTEFTIAYTNVSKVKTLLLLPFFFTRKSSVYLPLCALRNSEIYIELKLKTFDKCIIRTYNINNLAYPGINGIDNLGLPIGPVPSIYGPYNEAVSGNISLAELYVKNIFLDSVEQQLFMNKELLYLIELYNIGATTTITSPESNINFNTALEFNNPTKFLFWVVQRSDVYNANFYDNYTYSFNMKYGTGAYQFFYNDYILNTGVFLINNNELTSIKNAIFLSTVNIYESFNTDSILTIYNFSFSLEPTNPNPTGTLNFSKVLTKSLIITLEDPTLYTTPFNDTPPSVIVPIIVRTYSCNYNILNIRDGLAGLQYVR